MTDFGNGSDGELVFTTTTKLYGNMTVNVDYNVTGNTLYLFVDRVYNFTNMNIGSGTIVTLDSSVTSGSMLLIRCTGTATIAGSIRLDPPYTSITPGLQQRTLYNGVWGPGVANGGSGGAGGDGEHGGGGFGNPQGKGFGGGAGGGGVDIDEVGAAANGGSGGNGDSGNPVDGDGGWASASVGFWQSRNGSNGSNTGGGGGAGVLGVYSGDAGEVTAYGGDGGRYTRATPVGEDGDSFEPSGTRSIDLAAAGGGGGGGNAGIQGIHFYLYAVVIVFTGVIVTSGSNGQTGGNGGDGLIELEERDADAGGGGGGGGAGGGNAGNIIFTYAKITDTGTTTRVFGLGGGGGARGLGDGSTGDNGINGSPGSNGSSGSYTKTEVNPPVVAWVGSGTTLLPLISTTNAEIVNDDTTFRVGYSAGAVLCGDMVSGTATDAGTFFVQTPKGTKAWRASGA